MPYFDAVVQESLKLPARVWKAVFVECILQANHSSRLAEIDVPTLILCGAHDEFAADDQAVLAAAIRDSRLRSIRTPARDSLGGAGPLCGRPDGFHRGLPSLASARNTQAA
jgi:pimeloyl-ACP methyl ester carboxylesterase